MGNSESNPIRNMDKRTARREYRRDFSAAIDSFRHNLALESKRSDQRACRILWEGDQSVRVCVRKRPIFEQELRDSEFDVISVIRGEEVVVHDARMHTDMRRQFINHHHFDFDVAFDEKSDNEEVYNCAVAGVVKFASVEGGYGTCLVYGQTGSGKTYTMRSIYSAAADDLFSQLESVTGRLEKPAEVSMSFIEIAGDVCHDLLNGFNPVQLVTGADGVLVHAYPVVEPRVTCSEELKAMIEHGCAVRSTAATGVHDSSSRSHAVLRIYVRRSGAESASAGVAGAVPVIPQEGVLTLVDLAGSEHRIDSMYHSADRRKECAAINSSLMALKECIRQRAAGNNCSHQYRMSKLTMALKGAFFLSSARTVVLATVSPSAKDTEHSLNTLRHASMMGGHAHAQKNDDKKKSAASFVTGGKVVTVQVGEVDVSAISRRNMAMKKAGKEVEAMTSNGNVAQAEVELTVKQKAKARRIAEKRAMAKLNADCREVLSIARARLGQDTNQWKRVRSGGVEQQDLGLLPSDEDNNNTGLGSPAGGINHDNDDDNDNENNDDNDTCDDENSSDSTPIVPVILLGSQRPVSDKQGEQAAGATAVLQYCCWKCDSLNQMELTDETIASLEKIIANHKLKHKQKTRGSDRERDRETTVVSQGGGSSMKSAATDTRDSSAHAAANTHIRSTPSDDRTTTTAAAPTPAAPAVAKEKKASFQKLYASIYSGEGDSQPRALLRRRLITLMKLNNYSDTEIQSLAPPSPTDKTFVDKNNMSPAAAAGADDRHAASTYDRRGIRRTASASAVAAAAPTNSKEEDDPLPQNHRLPRYGGVPMRNDFNEEYATAAVAATNFNAIYEQSAGAAYESHVRSPELRVQVKSHGAAGGSDATAAAVEEKRRQAAMTVEKQASDRANRQQQARANREKMEREKKELLRARIAAKGFSIQQEQQQQDATLSTPRNESEHDQDQEGLGQCFSPRNHHHNHRYDNDNDAAGAGGGGGYGYGAYGGGDRYRNRDNYEERRMHTDSGNSPRENYLPAQQQQQVHHEPPSYVPAAGQERVLSAASRRLGRAELQNSARRIAAKGDAAQGAGVGSSPRLLGDNGYDTSCNYHHGYQENLSANRSPPLHTRHEIQPTHQSQLQQQQQVRQEQQQQQLPQQTNTRSKRIGAAAAPFANDMSWDTPY